MPGRGSRSAAPVDRPLGDPVPWRPGRQAVGHRHERGHRGLSAGLDRHNGALGRADRAAAEGRDCAGHRGWYGAHRAKGWKGRRDMRDLDF